MKSIAKRLNIVFVSVVTVVLVGSGALNYFTAKNELEARRQEQSAALTTRLKLGIPTMVWNFDKRQIDMTLEAEMMEQDIIGILIKNKNDVTAGRLRDPDGKIRPASKEDKCLF